MTIPERIMEEARIALRNTPALFNHVNGKEETVRIIARALLAAEQRGVAREIVVKPLEWKEIDLKVAKPPLIIWEAKTPFMNYTLESVMDRPWFCHFICAHFKNLEDAKAAAQADYEARIRSALTDPKGDGHE